MGAAPSDRVFRATSGATTGPGSWSGSCRRSPGERHSSGDGETSSTVQSRAGRTPGWRGKGIRGKERHLAGCGRGLSIRETGTGGLGLRRR